MYLAADLLSPDPGLFFWILLVFGILLYVLRRFAWGPITDALEQREKKIAASLSQAEAAAEEARALQSRNDQARREAEQEAQKLLRETREEAERIREAEVQRTREEIAALRAKAQEEIERDKEAALQAVRNEVASLAVLAAERILRSELDQHKQMSLVDQFLDDLPKN